MQRLTALRVLLLLTIAGLVGRLYQIQLVDSEARRYSNSFEVSTTRHITVAPRRGEIFAADGTTLLAESVPIYNIAVLPGSLPPVGSAERIDVLGKLAHIAGLTSTLTLSPSLALLNDPGLRNDLARVTLLPGETQFDTSMPLTFTVSPRNTLAAIAVSRSHTATLTFVNPIEAVVARQSVRRYESVVIKEDVPQSVALVVRENTTYMPGAVVVEGYRRRYPQSGEVPSLSHMLGYMGRVSECELEVENPAANWVESLMDTVRYAPGCGLVRRRIDPAQASIPPYGREDRIGKDGLEASYEEVLRGRQGIAALLVDALERPVSEMRTIQPVQDGMNLVLTIDMGFQGEVERILRRWIAEGERRRASATGYKNEYAPITSGVAIALDPRDGRVLAMVSLPDYDNNIWVDPRRVTDLQNLLSPPDLEQRRELERLAPLTNRAIAGQYPPGSTLKQFVGAIALQMGIIQVDTKLRDPGRLVLTERGGTIYELPNSSRADNKEINVSDALRLSSNVFFASIAGGNSEATNLGADALRTDGLGINRLAEGLEWFGFGRTTGIRLAGESNGLVPTPTWKSFVLREPWTTGNTYNTAIGQGYLAITPLQLVTASAAVVNNGVLYRPRLVQRIIDNEGNTVEEQAPQVAYDVPIDPAYLAVMREGMRRSVTEGLNVAARDECSGLSIAGKTGTAEFGPLLFKPDGSPTRQSHAWFVGFAPYDNPELAVVVLLEGTGDLNDGSATLAVPAVTQIMQAYFNVAPPADRPNTCPVMPEDAPPATVIAAP